MPARPSSHPRRRPREMMKTAVETKSPHPLIAVCARFGKKASTIAAATGAQISVLKIGINILELGCAVAQSRSCAAGFSPRNRETARLRNRNSRKHRQEHDHADEEHQRVVTNVSGLEEAQHFSESADDESEHRGDAVDDRVDSLPEESRQRGQRTHDDRGGPLADVPLVLA